MNDSDVRSTSPREWRLIPGYEWAYMVSDLGEVWSRRAGRELKQTRSGRYLAVTLSVKYQKPKKFRVHTLVALAFFGLRPEGREVRHLDGDLHNNAKTNLAYGTRSENNLDAVRHGTHPHASKTHCPQRHEYNAANTRWWNGHRYCRPCGR